MTFVRRRRVGGNFCINDESLVVVSGKVALKRAELNSHEGFEDHLPFQELDDVKLSADSFLSLFNPFDASFSFRVETFQQIVETIAWRLVFLQGLSLI